MPERVQIKATPVSKLEELIYEERKTAKHAKLREGASDEDPYSLQISSRRQQLVRTKWP